jgi:hypothetical protein
MCGEDNHIKLIQLATLYADDDDDDDEEEEETPPPLRPPPGSITLGTPWLATRGRLCAVGVGESKRGDGLEFILLLPHIITSVIL